MSSPFRAGAASHVGMLRTMNEDAFVVRNGIVAVADGMGGHLAGEVASAMAIDALGNLDGATSVESVVDAVIAANDEILQMSRTDASRRGMGTTLTAIAIVHPGDGPDELAIVNLGDSRTYRFRSGRLEQITVDHSYVQELVAGGHLTPDEARLHPQRNIVTRALGIEPRVGIDVWNTPLVRGDRYLLCSDGLVDEVADPYIAEVLGQVEDPQQAADQLVDMANRAGGRDNVTVVVVDIIEGADEPLEPPPTTPLAMTDATLAAPRELVDDSTGERVHPPEAATEPAAEVTPVTPVTPVAPVAPPPDATLAMPVIARSDEGSSPAGGDEPSSEREEKGPKRRVSLIVLGIVGALAIVAGILIVALRDENSTPETPTTTVPATTTIVVTTTTSPVTTTAAPPTTLSPPTTT